MIWRDVRVTAWDLMQDGRVRGTPTCCLLVLFRHTQTRTHMHACAPNGVEGAVARVASFTSTFNDRVGFRVVVSSWGRHVS